MSAEEILSSDLVIIGAGAAGLTAAVSAAEAGLKNVLVLEARKGVGGNGNFVYGYFAAESKVQRHYSVDVRKDDIFKMIMSYHHWKTDPRRTRLFIDKASETMEWLEGHGVVWGGLLAHFHGIQPLCHHHAIGAKTTGGAIIGAMRKSCDKFGVKIMTETRGMSLLMDKGKVVGVKATSKDKELTINAKSVLVATGGLFGAEKMVQESINWPVTYEDKNFVSWGLRYNGDGVRMLTEVGAAREGRILLEAHAPVFAGELKLSTYVPPLTHLPIFVNKKGERFADEAVADRFSEGANAFMRQPEGLAYSLYDEAAKEEMLKWRYTEFELAVGEMLSGGVPKDLDDINANRERLDKDFEIEEKKGFAKKANTVRELAEYIGCEPKVLEATVAEYNGYCDKGHDDDFVKDPYTLRPLRRAPFYALKCRACVNTIQADIKCDLNQNVLNKQGEPIAGLYAAGVDTFLADWSTYNNYLTGHSFSFSVNGGRMAGENAAKFVLGK